MAALLDIVTKASTDRSIAIRIIDSTAGTPETGVTFETAGIDLWYRREGAIKTSITEVTLATLDAAHSDGGFLHIADGEYRLDLPDAAFATGANYVDVGGTVTGMVVIGGRVRLVDYSLEAISAHDWYVSTVGSNSNGGHTRAMAKQTVAAAVVAATAGDTIHLGSGVFTENVDAHAKDGLRFVGEGFGTQLTSASGVTLDVGDFTTIERMRVSSTGTAVNEWALTCYNLGAAESHTGIVVRDCYLDGVYDGLMAYGSTDLLVERSTIRGKADGINLRGGASNWLIVDSDVATDCTYASGDVIGSAMVAEDGYGQVIGGNMAALRNDATAKLTYALRFGGGQYLVSQSNLVAKQLGAGTGPVAGIGGPLSGGNPAGTTGIVTVTGGSIYTSQAGTGAEYSLWRTSGTLAVGPDLYYDSTKTSGTITQTPGVAALTTNLATVDGIVDDILTDTGTTLSDAIADVPTVSEFNARTLPAADYVVVGDTIAGVTTVTTTTNLTNLPAVTEDWLTAAGVKADAVTKIQSGLATPTNITAASGVSLASNQHVIVDSGSVTVSDKTGFSLTVTPPTAAQVVEEMDANSTQLAAIVEDTGTTLPAAIAEIEAGSGATPEEIWEYATRNLTGGTGTTGPTAQKQDADAYITCPKGGTVALSKNVSHIGGTYITQATVSTITYSIFALDATDEDTRSAVAGHQAVALTVASVVWDTLQTDQTASDWNLRHIVDVSAYPAFTDVGTTYLVEYTITPTSGQVIVTRVMVRCE